MRSPTPTILQLTMRSEDKLARAKKLGGKRKNQDPLTLCTGLTTLASPAPRRLIDHRIDLNVSVTLRSELVAAVREKTALLILGTGVTLSATRSHELASWTGLIRHGVARIQDLRPTVPKRLLQDIERLLRDPTADNLIVAAERVTALLKEIPGGQFDKWLRDTVGKLELQDTSLLQSIRDLKAPICTTNYDTVLDDYLDLSPITWRDGAQLQVALRGESKAIAHLHGVWSQPESVVFGYGSYGDAIHHGYSQALVRALSALHTVIFIGMGEGIKDPNFAGITKWLKSALPDNTSPPVVLLTESEVKRSYDDFTARGVLPLSYGVSHDDLAPYLGDIAREASSSKPGEPRSLTWEEVCGYLGRLFNRLYRDYQPDIVVAMSGPGNFAPAYCMKHDTNDTPVVCAVTFPSRMPKSVSEQQFLTAAGAAGWIHQRTSRWDIYLPNVINYLPLGTKILLFDDRVVTGEAQRRMALLLTSKGFEVKRAALIIHPQVEHEMDYYELALEGEYYFPWGGKLGRSVR